MRSLISLSTLTLLILASASCHPSKDSQPSEQWNSNNNPLLFMAYQNEFETRFDALPLSGRPDKMPWSDHYWPTYHGGITYRWNWSKTKQLDSLVANSSDRQFAGQLDDNPELQKLRSEVLGYQTYTKEQLATLSPRERTRVINSLSTAEKFDIYRGDFTYPTVTSERKRTGIFATLRDKPEYEAGKKIPTWFGLCHAWAPATILFDEPGPVVVKSKDGFDVPMAASDVKALLTYMIDDIPSQARSEIFLAERCNNDISEAAIDEIMGLFAPLQPGNTELLKKQIDLLLENEKIDLQTMLIVASFMYAFSPDQAYAAGEYQRFYERLRLNVRRAERSAFGVSYLESQKNFENAGKPEATNLVSIREGVIKAVEKPACNDTNPGSFHLVVANMMGIQKRSFVLDITRDAEVWNQAVAAFESQVVGEFTGDAISDQAAPGTVKEVQIRTRMLYTTEMMPAWEPFGDDKNLKSYHVSYGDSYLGRDGRRFKALEYKIELDREGRIIGGSWISRTRPDFIWASGTPIFDKKYSDVEDIYYMSLEK